MGSCGSANLIALLFVVCRLSSFRRARQISEFMAINGNGLDDRMRRSGLDEITTPTSAG
jgi:hypothetical protein